MEVEGSHAVLAGLPETQRSAVEVLAVGGALPLGVVEGLVGAAPVAALEARRAVEVRRDHRRAEVTVDADLATAALAVTPVPRLRAHLHDLIAAITRAGANRDEDRLRLARWQVRLGGVADWRFVLEVAEELAGVAHPAAAELATRTALGGDPGGQAHLVAALDLARAAADHGGGEQATVLIRDLCTRIGDHIGAAEAEAALDGRVRRPPRATPDGPALRALELAVLGRAADSTVADRAAASRDRLLAAAARAGALCQIGRTEDALRVTEEALTAVSRDDQPSTVWALLTGRLYALILGGRPGEAEAVARSCREIAARAGRDDGVAGLEVSLASATLALGRPRTAMAWASTALARIDDEEMRRVALGVKGTAAAVAGDAEAAARIAAELAATPSPYVAVQSQVLRSLAWAEVVAGDVPRSIEVLHEAAATCRENDARAGELAVLHDVARLGRADTVLDRVAELIVGMDGTVPLTVHGFIRSLVEDDAVGLEGAAHGFHGMGTILWEAEAWALASVAHRRQGRTARAVTCASSSRSAAGGCEGATTPALAAIDAP